MADLVSNEDKVLTFLPSQRENVTFLTETGTFYTLSLHFTCAYLQHNTFFKNHDHIMSTVITYKRDTTHTMTNTKLNYAIQCTNIIFEMTPTSHLFKHTKRFWTNNQRQRYWHLSYTSTQGQILAMRVPILIISHSLGRTLEYIVTGYGHNTL